MTQKVTATGQFWIVRKPDSQGAIVAKFETTADDPDSIPYSIPDSCIVQTVSSRSALVDKTVDTAGLSYGEKDVLGAI